MTFECHTAKIEGKLRGNLVVDQEEACDNNSFRDKVAGIKGSAHKRNGRTDEAIEGDCRTGMIGEFAAAKLLGVDIFDVPWDIKNRSSYSKDVIYGDVRVEVKTHHVLRYFTVNRHSFKTLMGNREAQELDVVLFINAVRVSDRMWLATPTLIVDPYPEAIDFRKLWNEREFSMVYPAEEAYKRNLCFPLIDLET